MEYDYDGSVLLLVDKNELSVSEMRSTNEMTPFAQSTF